MENKKKFGALKLYDFKPTIIAEAGVNHGCNINLALPYQASDGLITYFYAGRLTNNGSETESYFTAISAQTDVVGVALDMTAGTYGQVQFYHNGSATGAAVSLSSSFANKSYGFPNLFKNFKALLLLSLKFTPIKTKFFSSFKSNKKGCSFRHGAHHDAQKFINVKLFFFKSLFEINLFSLK